MIGKCDYCATLFGPDEKRCDGCGAPLPLTAHHYTPVVVEGPTPQQPGYWPHDALPYGYPGTASYGNYNTTTNNATYTNTLEYWRFY